MQTVRTVAALRSAIAALRGTGGRIALVPTMGALHAGHMALIEAARKRAAHVVASIFVNPRQFGAHEDLDAYPRRERHDAQMLDQAGCTLLWCPTVEEMYPAGAATTITVSDVSAPLEGVARPGHFDGVATVVAKLFNQVQPDVALFGEKDWQQLAVIRRMAADLDFAIDIVGVPTERDDHGLALSSRNAYLSAEELIVARALPRALGEAAAAIAAGGAVSTALDHARQRLTDAGFGPIDYIALADPSTLAPLDRLDGPARLLAAARLGKARLIDNIAVNPA